MAVSRGPAISLLGVILFGTLLSRTADASCPLAHTWRPKVVNELSWLSRSLLQQEAPKVRACVMTSHVHVVESAKQKAYTGQISHAVQSADAALYSRELLSNIPAVQLSVLRFPLVACPSLPLSLSLCLVRSLG